MTEDAGERYTLTLVEELRKECGSLQRELGDAYFRMGADRQLNNPNHDMPLQMPFRVEMLTGEGQHIRWVTACEHGLGRARRVRGAVKNYPGERWTLRNGMLVIREHR
jgi:hypothetical protein